MNELLPLFKLSKNAWFKSPLRWLFNSCPASWLAVDEDNLLVVDGDAVVIVLVEPVEFCEFTDDDWLASAELIGSKMMGFVEIAM